MNSTAMKIKILLLLIVLCFGITGIAHARKKAKKKSATSFKLVEAYTQRTIPGIRPRPGQPAPQPTTNFVIVWQAATYPETFFWRGDGGWLSCRIDKAHKATGKLRMPAGKDYMTEVVMGDQIHKGDTLLLTPVTGGRFPIPSEIPETAKNTLFYKTGGSKWLSFRVENIAKKRDIVMP